jgi:hypothetical protein
MAFAGAAYAGVRSEWPVCIVLLVIGAWSATTARQRPTVRKAGRRRAAQPLRSASILGVGPDASKAEIQAAYSRLIRMAHPDKGGTAGLAAQLNAARDRLLDGK